MLKKLRPVLSGIVKTRLLLIIRTIFPLPKKPIIYEFVIKIKTENIEINLEKFIL